MVSISKEWNTPHPSKHEICGSFLRTEEKSEYSKNIIGTNHSSPPIITVRTALLQ